MSLRQTIAYGSAHLTCDRSPPSNSDQLYEFSMSRWQKNRAQMDDDLQISKSVLLLYMLIVIMCIGSRLLFWRSTWPPSILQIGAAIIGTLLGCLYYLDRIRNW